MGGMRSSFLNLLDSCGSDACFVDKRDNLCSLGNGRSLKSLWKPFLCSSTSFWIEAGKGMLALFNCPGCSGRSDVALSGLGGCCGETSSGSWVRKGGNASSLERDRLKLSRFNEFPRVRGRFGRKSGLSIEGPSSTMLLCLR